MTDAPRSGAESGRRALDLLFAFEDHPVATVRTLAEHIDIPAPSAHRYVAMLRDMGLIEEVDRGRYRLTMRVAALAQAARQATPLIDLVKPFMTSLADATQETVLLVQPVAGLMVCVQRLETRRRVRLSFEVGQHMPPLRGASAHLYVGSLPSTERRTYVEAMLARGEEPPVPGVEAFLAAAAASAERGWAVSSDEIDEGVWAAAAPLYDERRFVGTLSVPAPAFLVTPDRADAIVAECRGAAKAISDALAGS